MSHANAALTPRHRLIVARLVVEEDWPISEVAARFQVSWLDRPHAACGNQPPFTRLTNLPDQYS